MTGNDARVAGNLAIANDGDGYDLASANNVVTGNMAIGNGVDGFRVRDDQRLISGNLAIANGRDGFEAIDGTSQFRGNVASANFGGAGFRAFGSGNVFKDNAAIANGSNGFSFDAAGTGGELNHNSVIGNATQGVAVDATALVLMNSIFGNHDRRAADRTNCGLWNNSGTTIVATRNFWGAATGPGADPADSVCTISGTTTVDPVTRSEIRINTQTTPFMP